MITATLLLAQEEGAHGDLVEGRLAAHGWGFPAAGGIDPLLPGGIERQHVVVGVKVLHLFEQRFEERRLARRGGCASRHWR